MVVAEFTLTEATAFFVPIGGFIGALIWWLLKGYVADLKSQIGSWRRIAEEQVEAREKFIHPQLEKAGVPLVAPLLAVVPEHDSPVTAKQQATADLETIKARARAVDLAQTKLNGDDSAAKLATDAAKLSLDAALLSENVAKLHDADLNPKEEPCP